MKRVVILGSGFSSLSSAAYLAKAGYEVIVYEKNDHIGGRASILERDGFRFDMGPSWYWMPDVFERFFADFGKTPREYYDLVRLDPAYRVYFSGLDSVSVPGSVGEVYQLFEQIEPGSSTKLKGFLEKAEFNYKVAMGDLVYKPGLSPLELVGIDTISRLGQFFSTIRTDVRHLFKDQRLVQILEFPVLFLGAKPENTPSFYNIMNYADLVLGTWYPMGGMYKVVEAMESLVSELGVRIHTGAEVQRIIVTDHKAVGIEVDGNEVFADAVLSGADYYHTEMLLPSELRSYSDSYWEKKVFAPSALLYYVAFDRKFDGLSHHTLFFDESFDKHAKEIYDQPQWPKHPLFYASFPTVTDASIAPAGKELACFLIPLAPGLGNDDEHKETYLQAILERVEKHTGHRLSEHVLFHETFSVDNFKQRYHSYKGNAYGLANTLAQTAFLRPSIKSKKVGNLYFTGQLTVPGPGVPPALISGKVAATQLMKEMPVVSRKQLIEENH